MKLIQFSLYCFPTLDNRRDNKEHVRAQPSFLVIETTRVNRTKISPYGGGVIIAIFPYEDRFFREGKPWSCRDAL